MLTERTTPQPIRRADYRPPSHLVDRIDLHVDLRETDTIIRARTEFRANPAVPPPDSLHLNGQNLELLSIRLGGEAVPDDRLSVTDDALTLTGVPDHFVLEVVTRIRPHENTALEGLYMSSGAFCTQCEAEGFRKITYFPDRPDVMARFTTTIEADKDRYPVLLSNGNPTGRGESADNRHWARWDDPIPKPCYLFALVAGDLVALTDRFRTRSGRDVALGIWVHRGSEDKCGHAMEALKAAMRWDEEVYGLDYDLDVFNIVAVPDFNMGAMENKGLNIFNTKYILAKPETATDADFLAVETVVAHEYFHNWTGNRITCRDWFQLSLKEGLTVFRDQQFSADRNSAAVKRILDVQRLRMGQFAEDSGPLAHPVRPDSYIEVNNFYTMTVYEKGAEVVRMLHTLLGPEGFRRGMDCYVARHDGQAVTCDDFVAAMEGANGQDLHQFRRWYAQAGTPHIAVRTAWSRETGTFALTLKQSTPPTPGQPDKMPLHIPVAIGLIGPDGKDRPVSLAGEPQPGPTTRVIHLHEAEQTFLFTGLDAEPVPSLFRGFSAPVKLQATQDEDQLAFRMAHDSDPFNRWESGQSLSTMLLLRMVAAAAEGRSLTVPTRYLDAVARLLDDAMTDPAFAALALTLPSEGYLGQQMPVIDVDAIFAARRQLRRMIGEALHDRWRAIYDRLDGGGAFDVSPAAIGRRSLRALALAYLMATDRAEAFSLCRRQFDRAVTMSESLAALQLICAWDRPDEAAERLEVIAGFHDRWQSDTLVIDKWFMAQAIAPRTSALADVEALTHHPSYQPGNPNKVYALVGAFAGSNAVRFHDRSGGGYRFLADQALSLDRRNPQVAARLLGAFSRWHQYDRERQAMMRAQLERIAATPGLSPDSYEIVTKSLGA